MKPYSGIPSSIRRTDFLALLATLGVTNPNIVTCMEFTPTSVRLTLVIWNSEGNPIIEDGEALKDRIIIPIED